MTWTWPSFRTTLVGGCFALMFTNCAASVHGGLQLCPQMDWKPWTSPFLQCQKIRAPKISKSMQILYLILGGRPPWSKKRNQTQSIIINCTERWKNVRLVAKVACLYQLYDNLYVPRLMHAPHLSRCCSHQPGLALKLDLKMIDRIWNVPFKSLQPLRGSYCGDHTRRINIRGSLDLPRFLTDSLRHQKRVGFAGPALHRANFQELHL